jgi:UDP-N-acetylglucosamine:LPS N-acetylglucosamine transferase
MKVLFITGSLNQGGAEFQILQLAKLFQDKGNEVEVFALTDYSFYKYFVVRNNLTYNHLENNQNKIKRVFLTSKKIKQFQPNLIISYLKIVSKVAVIAKILSNAKVPVIVGDRTSYIQPWHDKLHFNLMRLASAVTVNSISKLD